ncbi:MAG TPA: type VI secretion system tube protein Hcp, partial [Thermoanaerobaculia bacterium]|nr:type VI secretion system tube protein Hcp [Thermoanaerobaculia bacterium]
MKIKASLLTFMLLLAALPLLASSYMNIPTIPGEAKDAAHQGWIEVSSFSWGSTPANAVVVEGGKFPCSIHQLNFTKRADKASPLFAQAAMTGAPIPSIALDVNGERHTLQNVQIKSVQKQQTGGGLYDAVSMSFTRCATHDAAAPDAAAKAINLNSSRSNAAKSNANASPTQSGPAPDAAAKFTNLNSSRSNVAKTISENASLTLSGNAPATFTLQALKFNGQNQAVLHCREAALNGPGTLLRAFQSKQSIPSLKIAAKASNANSPQMTFTFTNVMVSGYQSGGSAG